MAEPMSKETEKALRVLNKKHSYIISRFQSLQNDSEAEVVNKDKLFALLGHIYPLITDYQEYEIDSFDPKCPEHFALSHVLLDKYISFQNKLDPQTIQQNTSNSTVNLEVKLPSINLPTFSGHFREWYTFIDSFNAIIGENKTLSNLQKLQYLKSSLTGEAARSINCLEISNANYRVALELLRDNFENQRIIVNSHIQALFDLPTINADCSNQYRELVSTVSQHLRSLESLKRPVDTWDDLIIHLVITRIPHHTRVEWENKCSKNKMPAFNELKEFLNLKSQTLESIKNLTNSNKKPTSSAPQINQRPCVVCNNVGHMAHQCDKFRAVDPSKRLEIAKQKRLCLNCLRGGHNSIDCKSSMHCRQCNKRHHTLLHLNRGFNNPQPSTSTSLNINNSSPNNVFLATCLIDIEDVNGMRHNVRAILDAGSQINIITSQVAKKLKLPTNNANLNISGVGSVSLNSNTYVQTNLSSKCSTFKSNLNLFILDQITNRIPSKEINPNSIKVPNDINLADPEFYKPANVDLLIGAELAYRVLGTERKLIENSNLILQNTEFGWIIVGRAPGTSPINAATCNTVTLSQLNSNVMKFWKIESHESEIPAKSIEELECETHFSNTAFRDVNGQFNVALPFKKDPASLGSSYNIAKKRLLHLEHKLQNNSELRKEYHSFMDEYTALGHMKRVSCTDLMSGYFLPHHAIIKMSSITTKLRVVFDASAKTKNGNSLNDLLMCGPTIQDDLFAILTRFRTYEYVITADIQMMYRQIKTVTNDNKYQRILWRNKPNDKISVYELQTVTYGTTCAPYLAVRCLQELSKDVRDPHLATVIARDFYMDDLLTGASTIEQARNLRDDVRSTLAKGGFNLRKWASNDPNILIDFPNDDMENHILDLSSDGKIKTLGIQWQPTNDTIEYHSFNSDNIVKCTKRNMLSEISRFFDPLGLLGPVIILAKLILQSVWQQNLDWDQLVPIELSHSWNQLKSELKLTSTIKIPRKVIYSPNSLIEIHAFGDASESAYGAAIYIKSIEINGNVSCELLCAKSKVAPLKALSLPRLELCAAVLTAQLVNRVKMALRREIAHVYYYSDSTIALTWIKSSSSRFKAFISHRIGEIQRLCDPSDWHHVESNQNPADIISRGALPSEIAQHKLWWHGPNFIKQPFEPKPFENSFNSDIAELRVLVTKIHNPKPFVPWIEKFSNFNKLLRVTAWVNRYLNNYFFQKNKTVGELTPRELDNAEILIIKHIQHVEFSSELTLLKTGRTLNKDSSILSLNPFIDTSGVLRVGGRLRNSGLEFNSKFPILLPKSHHVTNLIIMYHHNATLHSGPQGTLASVRTKYWPIAGRSVVRKNLRNCITCFKALPKSSEPMMANLPAYRSEQIRPFVKTGIDYCGPFLIKEGKRKTAKLTKVYVALFVCMSTKAIHLEIVSDLTTESFLAALRRFISRRGMVTDLYSDNATTFVGANRQIKELYTFLNQQVDEISSRLTLDRITWHFIPPRAPHFGGLWEAGVKSTKRHLYRVAGCASLTYEELNTLLTQVEAILNSRPLCPLSSDPNDLSFLSPGHFLIGDSLRALPEPSLEHLKIGRLSRWQHLQSLQQHFWSRWQREYLQELQARRKWKQSKGEPIKAGQLVLIREDNTPPSRWRTGRVEIAHQGKDGIVRSATVKTANDLVLRPCVKLCAFPSSRDDEPQ